MVTHELAQYFSSAGAEVVVACYGFSEMWREQFERLSGVAVHRIDDPALDASLEARAPDLAWIHHQVIPERVLRSPDGVQFVFHHMSSFEPQEFPTAPAIEAALASAIFFPAEESMLAQEASGLFAEVGPERLMVLGNPAPDSFKAEVAKPAEELRRLLVVSNHVPAEMSEALEQLRNRTTVTVLGANGLPDSEQRLVTPDDIARADAVVTIGKTAQYALVGGTPVFCYDHFGGPGWLSQDNFERVRSTNFSGRGFSKRSAPELIDEILTGFHAAAADSVELHSLYADRFLLSTALDRVAAMTKPQNGKALDKVEVQAFLLRQTISNGLVNTIEARDQSVSHLSTLNRLLEEKLEKTSAELGAAQEMVTRVEATLARVQATPGVGIATKASELSARAKERVGLRKPK